MNVAIVVNRALLVLLGVSTGAVKLARMEAEMVLFRGAGFSDLATIGFGVVQIAATLACLHRATRLAGAVALGLTFVAATGVLFVNGLVPFGVFSVLFIAMAAGEAASTRIR